MDRYHQMLSKRPKLPSTSSVFKSEQISDKDVKNNYTLSTDADP